MKKLKEIRFSPFIENIYLKNGIGRIGHLQTQNFLVNMGNYNTDCTSILLLTAMTEIQPVKYVNHDNIITETSLFINEAIFLKLNDKEKLEYTVDLIYKSLLDFSMHYKLVQDPICIAKQKIISNDYFYRSKLKSKNKKKNIVANIESLEKYEEIEFRLCIKANDGTEKKYPICTKKHIDPAVWNKMDIYEMMEVPQSLKNEGWINENDLLMNWGKNEKYIFNLAKEVMYSDNG